MALDEIQILYKCYGILEDAKDGAREHPEQYETILNSTTGTIKEKKLGATFIPRFYKYFPDLQLKALNCLMDLCEEYDTHIRRLAIQALPLLCRDSKDHLNKIADVLTQLLPSENDVEMEIVRKALNEVIALDPKEAILGIFSQINAGDDEAREQAVNFLKESVLAMIPKVFDPNPEASETLVEEIQKAMHDVTAEEFRVFISLLSKLKTFESKHDELVDLIAEQAELKNEVNDVEALDKYVTCTRVAIPFFQKGANAEKFFLFLVGKIFPVMEVICIGEDSGDIKLDLYKILAEICTEKISDEALHSSLKEIFDRLLHYMPLPEVNEEKTADAGSEESTEPQIQFSHVECLMYSFHKVARKYPEFLTAEDATERLRDFKLRLQYVGQRCQVYIKQIKMALNQKSGNDEEVKVKVIALKTTSNIHTLIKDLFHSPPSYNSTVNLSWVTTKSSAPTTSNKKETVGTDNVLAEKRKRAGITPITFDTSPQPKRASNERRQMEYYLPPGRRAESSNGERKGTPMSGRYNTRGNRRGFRGRGGRWRSRGSSRGWNY